MRPKRLAWIMIAILVPSPMMGQEDSPNPPEVYTYRDGERTLKVVLQEDMVMSKEEWVKLVDTDDIVAEVGEATIVRLRSEDDDDDPNGPTSVVSASTVMRTTNSQPVFRSQSGGLMALPGGVIVIFDEAWDSDRAMDFFAAEGIEVDRVTPLRLINSYLVETDPGFPSLNLAHQLANHPGVDVSTPNWWREVNPQ